MTGVSLGGLLRNFGGGTAASFACFSAFDVVGAEPGGFAAGFCSWLTDGAPGAGVATTPIATGAFSIGTGDAIGCVPAAGETDAADVALSFRPRRCQPARPARRSMPAAAVVTATTRRRWRRRSFRKRRNWPTRAWSTSACHFSSSVTLGREVVESDAIFDSSTERSPPMQAAFKRCSALAGPSHYTYQNFSHLTLLRSMPFLTRASRTALTVSPPPQT
jgi:hypothetical protein